MVRFPRGTLVAAADGLGHGKEAARAANLAVDSLQGSPGDAPPQLLRRCHAALNGTRGVVLSVASFDHDRGSMSWLGVGNVWGGLFPLDRNSSPRRRILLLRSGVVGVQLPSLLPEVLSVRPGDTLLFATDGIRGDSILELPAGVPAQRLAEELLVRHQTGTDDALVFVARGIESRS